jgi:hypothetical protein
MEDDRLALLEQRLLRVSKQLKAKKKELEEFVQLHGALFSSRVFSFSYVLQKT